jgi:hypothetical protein
LAQEEYRLLATSLLLSEFTKAELARTAGANVNTVGSWLNRNRRFFEHERTTNTETPERGRPRNLWRVRGDATAQMRQQLSKLQPPNRLGTVDLPADGQLNILKRVEKQIDTWRHAIKAGDHAAATDELVTTRSWIRMAWEDFAELESSGFNVPSPNLRHLAELEREAGAGSLPDISALPQITIWLTERLSAMTQRGVSPNFAGRTVRMRSEVRSEADRVKLTAAATAAPIWSDEGLAEEYDLDVNAIQLCKVVAQHVPAARRVEEVAIAIGRSQPWSYCQNSEEAQAVALGLVTQYGSVVEPEVGNWLAGLHVRDEWRPELALAVVRGLGGASGVIMPLVMRNIADPLRTILDRPPLARTTYPGKIRNEALEYGKRALAINVTEDDPIARFQRYGSTLAYRPDFAEFGFSS